MRNALIALGVIAVLLSCTLGPLPARIAAASPAQSSAQVRTAAQQQAHASFLEKTRFLADAGAAFYAFHHFVWARYQNGQFGYGAQGRAGNFVKAGIALVFSYHELKAAYNIALSSKSKALHLLVAPIAALLGNVNDESAKLKRGQYSASDMQRLDTQVTTLGRISDSRGYAIRDIPVPVPGAA